MRSRFIQNISSGGPSNQCVDVTFDPPNGNNGVTVTLASATAGSHIFYTISANPVDPTHSGDNATGTTIRIGSNTGSVVVPANPLKTYEIRALAYKNGLLDSNITFSDYFPPN